MTYIPYLPGPSINTMHAPFQSRETVPLISLQDGLVLTGSDDCVLHMWRPQDQPNDRPVDRKKVTQSYYFYSELKFLLRMF